MTSTGKIELLGSPFVRRKLVCVESPFRAKDEAERKRNEEYLADAVRDCMAANEAPFAMHWFYPQFLDDDVSSERVLGMNCGKSWTLEADIIAFYYDLGISEGMRDALVFCNRHNLRIEFRSLKAWAKVNP